MKDPSEVFHRAKLIVEQVEPYTDGNGCPREKSLELARVEAVDNGPEGVVAQLADAVKHVLYPRWCAPTDDDDGAARRKIKAEALLEAAGSAPDMTGGPRWRAWLRDQANALVGES